jgi:Raf kinase inhibitor-like YbhB/YbcL family protein
MLEHVPAWLGALLHDRRAGHEKLVAADPAIAVGAQTIDLTSPAFANGARLPVRFTADGGGISPPLVWTGVPAAATALALIVEDPDAPTTAPLVHALLWDLPPDTGRLAEGAIGQGGAGETGRNSYLQQGWLPPDPPTGHGDHDYVFQLFALSDAPDLGESPGRGAFVEAITGRVLATGLLIGTYSREEPSQVAAPQGAVPA